jgi:hypothetical protein
MTAVNGSAKVGVDTHKWFNPQIQFNPGMFPPDSHFFSAFCIHFGNILQKMLMTDIDYRDNYLMPVIAAF